MWEENGKLYRAIVVRKKNIGENPAWKAWVANPERSGIQPNEFLFSDTETSISRYGPYLAHGAATQAMKREAYPRYGSYSWPYEGSVVDKWVEEIPIPDSSWERTHHRGR